MGEPITTKCKKKEILYTQENGERVCIPNHYYGAGESTSVRIQGYFLAPEKVSTINLEDPAPQKTEKNTPPVSHDQFQPSPEVSLQKTINGNEKVCGVATVRREVCNTLKPGDCFQDRQEEELCATGQTAKQALAKLCAGYYRGMGLAVQHHQDCWSYAWLSFSGPEQKK